MRANTKNVIGLSMALTPVAALFVAALCVEPLWALIGIGILGWFAAALHFLWANEYGSR